MGLISGATSGSVKELKRQTMKTQKKNQPSTLRFLLLAAFAVSASLLFSGCIATADEAETGGGTYYLKGDLEDAMAHDLATMKVAVKKAIEKEGFFLIEEDDEAVRVMYHIRDKDDEKINVKLTRISDTVTEIKVRFGLIGDKARSIYFLKVIKGELPEA